MQQITFTAGYGDPNRTIQQKYGDYGKIDQLMARLRMENTELEEQINGLENQRTSLIYRLNNVQGEDDEELKSKIMELTERINSLKDKIEENRETGRKAWYGFHERY